jgi:hypothetical protein
VVKEGYSKANFKTCLLGIRIGHSAGFNEGVWVEDESEGDRSVDMKRR